MENLDKKAYSIRVNHLKPGKNPYHFDIGSSFLDLFNREILADVKASVDVEVNKTSAVIEITYQIDAELVLLCDRCLQPFSHAVKSENVVLYSFNPAKTSQDEEIIVISSETDLLDLSQDMYDFLCLEVPVRRIPEDGSDHRCPPEIMELFSEEPEEDENSTDSLEEIDPRWEQLNNLKSKLN